MSRLFLMVFVAGMLVIAPAASADVPNCDCLDDWDATWEIAAENCLFVCPGASTDPYHGVNTLSDNQITLYSDDGCSVPLQGFDAMRIDLTEIYADSICVCDDECSDFPYIYPLNPTDASGHATFRFRGSILQLENDYLGPDPDVAWLQVTGCQDRPVRFRSPDVNADCVVGLSDQVTFSQTTATPTGYQHYTVYATHCAPPVVPGLGDQVVFSQHIDHTCTHVSCDP
jgi:hypothetical protein